MIVRQIHPEEYKRVQQLCALAFDFSFADGALPAEEVLRKAVQNPQSREQQHWQSQWAAFADDNQTMLSTFTAIPYRCHFDGHDVSMIGIGGVATLPEYRRQGGIRACFEHALPEMYADGAAFSYLYPFSTAFYRKFGYELGCEKVLCQLRLSGMPRFEANGSFHLLEPGASLEADIRKVEGIWQQRYNLMIVDEDIEYRWIAKADPFRDQISTYVYRNAMGVPKGVMTFQTKNEGGIRALDATKRFCFVDAEGFRGLLHLALRLAADYDQLWVTLPTDVELGAILPEWSFGNIKRTLKTNGMVRVIDAAQVLRLARMRGTGDLVIELCDEQIAGNNGRFLVCFADGKTTSVTHTEAPADVALSIQDFSRLICGRYDVSDWQWLPDAKLFCAPEKAAQVFYRKPMMITRPF